MRTPIPEGAHLCAVTYPGRADQARAVRADLRVWLGACPLADDLILCASELAANAALHSRSGLRGATFTVRAETCPGSHARVEVQDKGGPWRGPVPGGDGHHGLDIVQALATTWGVDGDQFGRAIWVRIDWPGS
ncbi:MAG TPA: ATP-binding protein [Streptosporangiaceae bacterium]